MDMSWLIPVILAVMVYAVICYLIKTRKWLPGVFDFMGPCLMIKTRHTGIFDTLAKPKKFLIAYASVGVILTILCAILITVMFVSSAFLSFFIHPEPTAPQNLLLIPGINEYVPSTFAVWFGIIISLVIHEAGHAILSRAENIRVKSTGLLALVIPIGAFVEPDEEDVEKSPLATKLRMFAAGITNNVVFGSICLVILIILLGLIIPGANPYVYGVYDGYPAQAAGVVPGTIIYEINGVPVSSMDDINKVLANAAPGDNVTVSGAYHKTPAAYQITLAENPGSPGKGFMGISFVEPVTITNTLYTLSHPDSFTAFVVSFFTYTSMPFAAMSGSDVLSFITADTPDPDILIAPFGGFWEIIHILFWCSWLNIWIGIINALPIGICDGGQMLREILRSIAAKVGMKDSTARAICSYITWALVFALLMTIIMPYLFQ